LSPAWSTFAGLTSRCTIRWRCANDSADARSSAICTLRASGNRTPVEPIGHRLAGQVLEHHERRAGLFVDTDVEDRHDRRVLHLRGGLGLALKSLEERRADAAPLAPAAS